MTDRPSSQSIVRQAWIALRFVLFGVTGFCVIFVAAICLVANLVSHGPFGPFTSLLFLGVGAVMLSYGVGELKRCGYIRVLLTMIFSLGAVVLILLGVLTISSKYCRVRFRSDMLLRTTDRIVVRADYPMNPRHIAFTNLTIATLTNKQDIELFRSHFKPMAQVTFSARRICTMYFYRGTNSLQSITLYDHGLSFIDNDWGYSGTVSNRCTTDSLERGYADIALNQTITTFLNHVGYDPSNFLNATQSTAKDDK